MDYGNAKKNIEEIFLETEISQISGKVVDFLFETFDKYSWIGLYIVHGTDLVLGPWGEVSRPQNIQKYLLEKGFVAQLRKAVELR